MKRYVVRLLPEARDDLRRIFLYIVDQSGSDIAERYVDSIVERYERLAAFPQRGTPRPTFGTEMRSISHKRRCLIVYKVGGDEVTIAGIFYGGQDVSARMETR